MQIQPARRDWFRMPGNEIDLALILLAVAVICFSFTIWLFGPRAPGESSKLYVYKDLSADNGVQISAIVTNPENIGLKAIQTNVTQTKENGINGGFFWEGYLLSIAVVNDQPVRGVPGEYGSGWYNTDRPRGTLVWDQRLRRFSVQVVDRSEDLRVSDRKLYWAQGGVSMNLKDDVNWQEQALAEEFPAMDEKRLRTGMVYDTDGQVWLLVTATPCTGPEFRDAVRQTAAPGKLVDGIFLDGDGSSQLQLKKRKMAGDQRAVYQMITLKDI